MAARSCNLLSFAVGTLGLCLSVLTAAQAQVTISPVQLEIPRGTRSTILRVSNFGEDSLVLQSEVKTWRQIEGKQIFDPTEAVSVVPPIVEIAPGRTQVFRVVLLKARPPVVEDAYRVVLDDVTPAPSEAGRLRFRVKHDLPLIVTPETPVSTTEATWSRCASPAGEVCARLTNSGRRRVIVRQVTLAGEGWQQLVNRPSSVLAESWMEWRTRIPVSAPAGLREVIADTDVGPVLARWPE